MTDRPRDEAFFLPTTLLRWGLAEVCCLLGNLAPRLAFRSLAVYLWGLAVRLNRHQEVAAMNRALALFEGEGGSDERAWRAFETVLEQFHNPWNTSASDLYLSRTPGRLVRRLATRLLWGPSAAGTQAPHDEQLQSMLLRLVQGHFRRWLQAGNLERARSTLEVLSSLLGAVHVEVVWGGGELRWQEAQRNAALDHVHQAAVQGIFLSPLDTLRWAERALAEERLELAEHCLLWGRSYLPEEPALWRLLGALAQRGGHTEKADAFWRRALAFDPQDVSTVLALARGGETPAGWELEIEVPADLALGTSFRAHCRLRPLEGEVEVAGWVLRVLPPAGRGVMPHAAEVPFDSSGRAEVELIAHRPHRVRGEPWPLVFLALGPSGHAVRHHAIQIPDPRPGRLLLTVTEDHEIHEERGHLGLPMLERLLVEKSRFASDRGVPWTHMVETGSTLAMPEAAADLGDETWRRLHASVRRHLVEEVAEGNGLEPHLHTFNDPAYGHFPYRLHHHQGEPGWQPHLRFLLTAAERRGDWASVCQPPNQDPSPSAEPMLNRLESVERAVAQLEELGRLGDPNYRPILWRSGLLEYGETPGDRAWSAVALRRAGLLADSDLPKPSSTRTEKVPAAFPAGWEQPFTPHPGGPLLQLPIVANLEGDYLMGPNKLQRRVHGSLNAFRGRNGEVRPGVHLFTILTHDKFLNARRGRDEFRLDRSYGDWPVIDRHLASWQEAGAEVVTARRGVEAVLDDLTWRPLPRLVEETFVAGPANEVRYRLQLLGQGFSGQGIPASAEFPHELLIPVPCFLRGMIDSLRICTKAPSELSAEPEMDAGGTAFWLRWPGGELPSVRFRLERRIGPRVVRLEVIEAGRWHLELAADEPFLKARLLLPWELGLPRDEGLPWNVRRAPSTAEGNRGQAWRVRPQPDGLLLENIAFAADDLGNPENLLFTLEGREATA